ncbi:MAG TPA: PD-(D/E)XK nuclease family protein [Candidatus Woesebacteria bacterium]|nr:PD-(D/E)XK nuclease family protein [Candidatus Woesebacteria bacterium]HPJ16700.1 PD-(D/E)XK nuclease family protein [Candidatus Woesebacteria bacterium]
MAKDKFSAVWVSHSSISAYDECPRSYYLKNVYKDPKTGHKIKLVTPPLSLGKAVHEVIESLSEIKTDLRFKEPLIDKYERAWKKVSGKNGGFFDQETEYKYKVRGEEMIRRVMKNPGPVAELAVKINMELPYYWLSEEDNIILCGKIDWLKYIPERDSVEIIDFKTSKNEEGIESMQLPIYNLLVHNCQKRKVEGAWYWYLGMNDELTKKTLPDLKESEELIIKKARKIKLARTMERFLCPEGEAGCRACRPYEMILKGEAEFVGNDEYKADVYVINKPTRNEEEDSVVL